MNRMGKSFEYMADRPKSPGTFQVDQSRHDAEYKRIGIFEVTQNSASGLMCKELKVGGSLQCPGFSNFDKYIWTRVGYQG